jgi:hypothetical protein
MVYDWAPEDKIIVICWHRRLLRATKLGQAQLQLMNVQKLLANCKTL